MKRAAIIIIFLSAIFVRFYNFPVWLGFDYDQEINANIAKEIVVNHKLTLIGPETSVGGMYVGPIYNYISALFFFLGRMNPESVIFLNLLVSLGTGIFCYLLAKEIFQKNAAGLFAVIIYAFSQTMIEFDRVTWNPMPMVFATLGLFYFLLRYLRERQFWQLVTAVTFVGISLQLHFTSLFLVVFFFLVLTVFGGRKFWASLPNIGSVVLVLMIFLLPLILFDLRHELLNSRHFLQFLLSGQSSQTVNNRLAFMMRIPLIFVSFFRATFFKQPNGILDLSSGVVLLGFLHTLFLAFHKEESLPLKLTGLLFLIYLLGLSFYHGSLPSQYFLPIFGLFIILSAGFLASLWARNNMGKLVTVAFLTVFIMINLPPVLHSENGLSLRRKRQAVDFIVADAGQQKFRVEFITAPGLKTGYNYLFWLRGQKDIEEVKTKNQRLYKIVAPYNLVSGNELSTAFGAIGVIKPPERL